jgi:hypothetical protein
MSVLVGFMVGVWVIFGVVVRPVFGASIPVITKLVLRSAAREPPEVHIHHLGPAWNDCFISNTGNDELSVWIGLLGWGQPMFVRVCRWGIVFLTMRKSATSSDLAAGAIMSLMI